MLLSMTGQGEAILDRDGIEVRAEVRAVNNRFLKVVARLSDCIAPMEYQLEGLVRQHLKRGSLQVTIRVIQQSRLSDYRLNAVALESYLRQAHDVCQRLQLTCDLNPGHFVALPGVSDPEPQSGHDDSTLTTAARQALDLALEDLNRMRETEGQAMAAQLEESLRVLEELCQAILQRAPAVIDDYRLRLENKVRQALAQIQVAMQPADILREVQLFADRADIREELVRLASHFQQFRQTIHEAESQGRKLDFLTQELFREINTVGSKANDATITQSVVEMKTIVEQIREIVQNVE
jgi:uncharacterized protein (TIGR00255 family)